MPIQLPQQTAAAILVSRSSLSPRGRPPEETGRDGSINAHCASVMSLG
jgi:hypothetical protein